MNYFYFFFFLLLSVIILFKPFTKSISDWVMRSEKLNKTGLITLIIGFSLTYFSLMQSFWYERIWIVVTLILGILLLIRATFIIFFLENIKKILPIYIKHYYKFSILFATYSILTLSCQGYKIVYANSSIIDIDKNISEQEFEEIELSKYRDSISKEMDKIINHCAITMEVGCPEGLLGDFISDLSDE